MLVDYSMRKWYKKPYWWVFRRLTWLLDRFFVQEHYADAWNVAENVRQFGVKQAVKVVPDAIKHSTPYPKRPHFGFNVIYYNPTNRRGGDRDFTRWLYGIDIIEKVKNRLDVDDIRFIELDGTADMSQIYPIADFMIRPNRHDGASRIRQECDVQGIPYYWTNGAMGGPITDLCITSILKEYVNHKKRSELQPEEN